MASRCFRDNRYIAAWIFRCNIYSYCNNHRVWLGRNHKRGWNRLENQGCPGLRIRLPNVNEAITTTTHAFVRLMAKDNVSRIRYQASDLLVRTARLLRELKPVKRFLEIPAVSRIQRMQNSSLGQRVFLAGTETLVSDFNFYSKSLSNYINNYHRWAPSLTPLIPTPPHISTFRRGSVTINT